MKILDKNNIVKDQKKRVLKYFLLVIFISAFFIRLFWIGQNPTPFHATEQFKSALLARSFFLNRDESRDDIARIPSIIFRNNREKLAPKVNEILIYRMYKIFGKENLIIPKIMSVIYWLIGGIILYKIALLLYGSFGGLISVIFYLFFPFGINISLSIQSESLLNMIFLWSVLQIIKHFRSGKGEYFYSAAMIAGFAVLIKINIIFPLLGLIFFLGLNKYGFKNFVFNRRYLWFFTVFFSIGTSFYLYNVFWNKSMQSAIAKIIYPKLLFSSFFWRGWLFQIFKVTGVIPLLLGVILFFTIKKKDVKITLAGLSAGYLIFALFFSYTTATHDYYQIALFPIIAMMLGQAGYLLERGKRMKKIKLIFGFSLLLTGVFFSLYHQNEFMKGKFEFRKYSPACFFVGEQGSYFLNNIPEDNLWGNAFEAGELTGHGINNILLSRSYGFAAMYFGKFYGRAWPTEEDFNFMRLRGRSIPDSEELFYSKFAKLKPKFFIITDLDSWGKMPGLQKFLKDNFRIFVKRKEFIIFDLRKKRSESKKK